MRAFLLSLLWLLAGPALAQEKLVGTNMDVRTILDFKVADAAIQKLLPPGFWRGDRDGRWRVHPRARRYEYCHPSAYTAWIQELQ